jgi:hypothetical protein
MPGGNESLELRLRFQGLSRPADAPPGVVKLRLAKKALNSASHSA